MKKLKLERCRSCRDLQFLYKNHLHPTSYWRVMIFRKLSLLTRQNNFRKIITLQYDVGWRWFLYKNCRSRWYIQLSSFKFFNLRTLSCSKNNIKFQHHSSACRIRKIIYFLYGVKWRYFYTKVVALNEIYNFIVLTFYI